MKRFKLITLCVILLLLIMAVFFARISRTGALASQVVSVSAYTNSTMGFAFLGYTNVQGFTNSAVFRFDNTDENMWAVRPDRFDYVESGSTNWQNRKAFGKARFIRAPGKSSTTFLLHSIPADGQFWRPTFSLNEIAEPNFLERIIGRKRKVYAHEFLTTKPISGSQN